MNAGQSGTTDNNDIWNLDRQDYVALVTQLRAELAAMTERKDGWRRVAREYWWLVSEDTMRRQSIIRRDRRRREARNGHTD